MSSSLHDITRGIWKRIFPQAQDHRAASLVDDWCGRLENIIVDAFGADTDKLTSDRIALYTNIDEYSSLHLWSVAGMVEDADMDVRCSRRLLSIVLKLKNVHADRAGFTALYDEFLMYMNADFDTGSVRFDDYMEYFPVWFVSRNWPREESSEHESPVLQIIKSWNRLDVSDSGLISIRTMENVLLPYAFQVLHPETASDILRERWIRSMLRVVDCTRPNWINHWMEYMFLDPKRFQTEDIPSASDQRKVNEFVEDALQYAGLFPMSAEEYSAHVSDYLGLMSQTTSSVESRSRAACLWVVSRKTGFSRDFLPVSIGERLVSKKPIITDWADFLQSLTSIWDTYFPSEDGMMHKAYFDIWSARIARGLNLRASPNLFILRKSLVERFISQLEVETLWDEYIGNKSTRIKPHQMIRLLHSVYRELFKQEEDSEGNWIIREWLEDITALALLIPDNRPDVIITKDVFLVVFPLWYASAFPTTVVTSRDSLEVVWPLASENRVIFSEPVLRTLLEKIWFTMMPAGIGLPCQEWWLMRCCNRLSRLSEGQGVTRKLLKSILLSADEVNYIYEYYQIMSSSNLIELLYNCLDKEKYPSFPTELAEEFFLIADNPPHRDQGDFMLPHSTFVYAFPLWVAAHS
jgi:hypothetical protein